MKQLFESKIATYQQPGIGTQGGYMAVTTAATVILSWGASLAGVILLVEVVVALGTIAGFIGGKLGT